MALGTTYISVTLVKTELSESVNSVGGLCTSDNINKWSRWKPTSINKSYGIVDADFVNANFGLTIPVWDGTNQVWTYTKPTGVSSSPYRLGDFRNYNHSAVAPFRITDRDGEDFNLIASSLLAFPGFEAPAGIYHISLDDLPDLDGYYFACQITNESSDVVWGSTANEVIEVDFDAAPFTSSNWRSGDLEFKFFFASELKGFNDANLTHDRKALNYDIDHPTTQTVTIVQQATIEAQITGVRASLSSGTWSTVNDSSFDQEGNVINGYDLTSSMAIRVRFKSLTGAAQTLNGTDLSWGVNRTHNYMGGYTRPMAGSMYNISGSSISSVSAPDGTFGTEIILYDANIMNRNSSGDPATVTPPKETETTMLVKQLTFTIGAATKIFTVY